MTQNSEKVSSLQGGDTQVSSWSERIPAAIAKGEEHVSSAGHQASAIATSGAKCKWGITAGEVALAKALWTIMPGHDIESKECDSEKCLACVVNKPLRAYIEKIEKIEP